jgi:hypothetical protein
MKRRSPLLIGLAATIALGASPALASAGTVITRYAGIGAEGAPTEGPATSSRLYFPEGVAVDSRGNVYIADTGNSVVEKVTPNGTLSIFAGDGSEVPPTPGPATHSGLSQPADVAVDSSGNVYIADSGNDVVEKVTPAGILSVIAGNGEEAAAKEGPALASPLHSPTGLAIDSSGDVYIGDTKNNRVEKVTPAGTLSFVAGNGSFGGPTQGAATASRLGFPQGLAIDSQGNLYIADIDNARVEKVTPGGTLSFFAGTGAQGAPIQGSATSSPLNHPSRLAVDGSGDVFIADTVNYRVEEVTPAGTLSFVAGTGASAPPTYGSSPLLSPVYYPLGIAVGATGVLYIADGSNNTIDRVGPETASAPTVTSATPGNGTGTIDFLPPVSYGTSAITGYEASTDGGATWHAISTVAGSGETLQSGLTGLTDGVTYQVLVRAVNGSGAGAASNAAPVTPQAPSSTSASPAGSPSTPATKASAGCLSRRAVTVHWRIPSGVRPGRIIVAVNGRTYKTLPARAREVTVSFAGMSGPAPVTVRVRTHTGKRLTLHTVRALHICTPPRSPLTLPGLFLQR